MVPAGLSHSAGRCEQNTGRAARQRDPLLAICPAFGNKKHITAFPTTETPQGQAACG